MNALALAALLMWGCSSTDDRESESPETTFQKIRDTFNQASTITMEYTVAYERWGTYSGSLAIKHGNRFNMTHRMGDEKTVHSVDRSDGMKRSWFTPDSPTCDWREAPEDWIQQIRNNIFRGFVPYAERFPAVAMFLEGSQSILGFKRSRLAPDLEALSYEVYRGVLGLPAGKVCLWYDPKDYRLRKLESTQDIKGSTLVQTLDHVELNGEIPDSLFVLPPENLIPRQIVQASAELTTIRAALDRYLIDNRVYPTTKEGLAALVAEPSDPRPSQWRGPYVENESLLKDPWGNPYFYRSPKFGINPEGYDLWSWGPYGTQGRGSDIIR